MRSASWLPTPRAPQAYRRPCLSRQPRKRKPRAVSAPPSAPLLLERQNGAPAYPTIDLVQRVPPSPSELALARALLRVIAKQAQADPDIQPHTVKIVFDMLSGLEEIWPLDPNGDYL